MPDHLHLSFWLKSASPLLMTATLKKIVAEFPFSKFRPDVTLRVLALDFAEAPLFERLYTDPSEIEEPEFMHRDTACQLEAWWELWRWEDDWNLQASPVCVDVYGPGFDSPCGEHVKIDLGEESLFLVPEEADAGLRPVQSNLQSVLHLMRDLELVLAVEKRLLWSDSGEDFAAKLGA